MRSKARQSVGDLMKRLLVDSEDRHLRAAVELGIVERSHFHDDDRTARRPGRHVRAAVGAELARHRILEVAARELLGRALGVGGSPRLGMTTNMLGAPPVMNWHSRQWHWPFRIGSPSATYRTLPQ